jgi:hypothetical protein
MKQELEFRLWQVIQVFRVLKLGVLRGVSFWHRDCAVERRQVDN